MSRTATPDKVLELPLQVRGLSLNRRGSQILDNLNFVLEAEPLSMVMGANGAGKSVLLRTLHGLLVADSGSINWNGTSADESLRRQQAMVFQKPVLLRRSVAANIDYVIGQRGVADTGMRDNLLLQVGLQSLAAQPAKLLSGGEQQRLALARALALKPRVLFLDEPTANLDPASVAIFESIVLAVHQRGTKIVFVTHDIGQARRLADDVLFLDRGRVAEHSEAACFFKSPDSAAADDYLNGRLHVDTSAVGGLQ